MAPPMQAAQSVALQVIPSGNCLSVTISEIARRPPGLSTRATSRNTRGLSAERLMTPLLMSASKPASSTGRSSI